MLSLNINNPIIKNYNIKQSFKKGLEEVKLQNSGKLEKKELKYILDEL